MLTNEQIMGIDEAHLSPIGEHRLQLEVTQAFQAMREEASAAGVDLQICSSFRSFERQLSIWNRKWQGQLPLNTLDGKVLDAASLNDEEKTHAIMLWSALPGASRHHWGTDFDVYDKASVERHQHDFQLIPEEYIGQGPCAQLSNWLNENANSFGFYFPYAKYKGGVAAEPWHMSYKPIAQKIIDTFDVDCLARQLNKSDILGKTFVINNLDYLVQRYTYNKGETCQ
ncbi:M15 family metallopeptidase [Glaciecola sp. 1036]|uniref:M15 family metallopeptidase n=1 Tax=Alteromonadaceae TaxID=72275 RepID=UPI003D0356F4